MKNYCTSQISIVLILLAALTLKPAHLFAQEAMKIIYETDMCADVDDVGGLAILHALANMGEAEILAVCYNEVHEDGVATIDAINTWYGRGDIPVGIYKGALYNPDGSGYLNYVSKFPHDLESSTAPSALDVYRRTLAEQPDSSVTIISVGFLENLDNLLRADADLVARKVKELVIMAGVHNDNFNLSRHNLVSVSEHVIRNWPTPLVISQEGGDILTGDNLQSAPAENPVREAFYRFFDNSYQGRPSWDEMTVLYGVRGLRSYFRDISSGMGQLSNGYVWQMQPGFRSYLDGRLSSSSFEKIIKELMDQRPIGAYFNASSYAGWLPFLVEFDASITNVGTRAVQQYLWDFGDGTSGEGEKVAHEYTTIGTFEVQLTVIDEAQDSLRTSAQIYANDPIFSPIEYFGDANNYLRNQEELWSTRIDSNDLRFYLSTQKRNSDLSLPGFCFVKDSSYSDFRLDFSARTGEELSQTKSADYLILFGYENDKNYNYLLIKNSTSRLVNISNGQSISIGFLSKKGMPDQGYHHIEINLSGNQLSASVDDSTFLMAKSARLNKAGKIGFGSANYAVFFDDIQISRAATSVGKHIQKNMPAQISLRQNYPNPFNPATTIGFELPQNSFVELAICDTIGRKIRTILNNEQTAGRHEVVWDGADENGLNSPSGLYFVHLKIGEITKTIKINLVR